MKLGTKLMLVTLALTVGITLFVGGFVTATVTSHEESRARAQISDTIRRGYFDRIEADQRQVFSIVRLLLEDPQYRALLQSLIDEEGEARDPAMIQLRDEVFARMVGREIGSLRLRPAFDLLLDATSREPVLVGARTDRSLEGSLRGLDVKTWSPRRVMEIAAKDEPDPTGAVLADPARIDRSAGLLVRTFVRTPEGLFLVFGMPLRVSLAEPPSHAYYVGFRVDDAWMTRMLGGREGDAAVRSDESDVHAWIRSGREFVAYGSSGAPLADRSPTKALVDFSPPKNSSQSSADRMTPLSFETGDSRMVGQALDVMSVVSTAPDGAELEIFFVSSLDEALAPLRALQRAIVLIGFFSLLIAILLCRWIARSISQPVTRLVEGTRRVAQGKFDEPVELKRNDELGTLAQSFNDMTQGLAQRDFIKDTFGKFVDPSVVEGLLSDPARLKPGGEVREQTVLFCDLAGFTKVSEKLEPQELVRMLNVYLGGAADAVTSERGIVDKFIGDAMLAFWGPPLTDTHADRACRAAFRISEHAQKLDELCAGLDLSGLRVRVGIATGSVLVGNIGSPNKFNYTVIGDTCNLASRLEGLNKFYGSRVLATWETISQATGSREIPAARFGFGNGILWRVVDRVRVVGKESPVVLCEVMAAGTLDAQLEESRRETASAYAKAMVEYESSRWAEARAAFDACASGGDPPARVMADRCALFALDGVPADWDGAWRMTSK